MNKEPEETKNEEFIQVEQEMRLSEFVENKNENIQATEEVLFYEVVM